MAMTWEEEAKQKAKDKTGCELGEVIFVQKDRTGSRINTLRLICDGGEGPFMMLEVEINTHDNTGKPICIKERFFMGEDQLRALMRACDLGLDWCKDGYAPGVSV